MASIHRRNLSLAFGWSVVFFIVSCGFLMVITGIQDQGSIYPAIQDAKLYCKDQSEKVEKEIEVVHVMLGAVEKEWKDAGYDREPHGR